MSEILTLPPKLPKSQNAEVGASKFCPGCGHGITLKALAKAIDELGIQQKTVFGCDIGCSLLAWNYMDLDTVQTHHGRTTPVIYGFTRANPDAIGIAYMGDGGGLAIGSQHLVNASVRGEKMMIIVVNNTNYGMTGGQMAPTTLVGMKTSTSPYGRDVHLHGYPLKIADIAAQLEGTAYVTRQSVETVPAIRKAKKAIRKAFENSMAGKGSNLVEIVSTCNSGWKMSPEKSNKWMQEHMFPFYPLGDLKDKQ